MEQPSYLERSSHNNLTEDEYITGDSHGSLKVQETKSLEDKEKVEEDVIADADEMLAAIFDRLARKQGKDRPGVIQDNSTN